jgi:hypothetical protein
MQLPIRTPSVVTNTRDSILNISILYLCNTRDSILNISIMYLCNTRDSILNISIMYLCPKVDFAAFLFYLFLKHFLYAV